jgi:hypothetical protein
LLVQSPAGVQFDIPPQNLVTALDAFGAASGVQVLYTGALGPSQRQSPGVIGQLPPETALKALLAGTGLTARYITPRDVVLVLAEPAGTDGLARPPAPVGPIYSLDTLRVQIPPEPKDWSACYQYAVLVQQQLQDALKANEHTGRRNFSVGISVWVTRSGVIQRSEVSNSTGDQGLDAAIAQALFGVAIRRTPPDDLPQPIHVTVSKRSFF